MKTAGFGCVLLAVALLLFVVSCHLLEGRHVILSARLSIASFVCMVSGLGFVTFDKRWAEEQDETTNDN